jgi:hypothetical protein
LLVNYKYEQKKNIVNYYDINKKKYIKLSLVLPLHYLLNPFHTLFGTPGQQKGHPQLGKNRIFFLDKICVEFALARARFGVYISKDIKSNSNQR